LGRISKMMSINKKQKKAYYFTMDALVAMIIILGVVLFIRTPLKQTAYESYVHEDLLNVLDNVKIGDINNTVARNLISSGQITDLDKTTLEQIGKFYADSNPNYQALMKRIIDDLNLKENLAIYFDNNLVANTSQVLLDEADTVLSSRSLLSGIKNGTNATGYAARAFLVSSSTIDYSYFGGYIGDGNISVYRLIASTTGFPNSPIENINFEGVFSGNFTLYINNAPFSPHSPIPNVPYSYTFNVGELAEANSATFGPPFGPTISFRSNNNLYIAGGFIKYVLNDNAFLPSILTKRKYISGVTGLINIYDGFYVPGEIINLSVSLIYNSSQNIFFTIGNTTVYEGNSSGAIVTIDLDDAFLSLVLDYSAMSENTVPFRIGLRNASYTTNSTRDVDVFSVTDLSGSMDDNCNPSSCEFNCGACIGNCKICDAKTANFVLINGILNNAYNRVGLAGYEEDAYFPDFHALSDNNNSLRNLIINTWDADGTTCICCGINEAIIKFRDLLLYYDGEGDFSDKANNNNPGVNGDTSLTSGGGITGDAIYFDGNGDYLDANRLLLSNNGTIAFWFKLNQNFNSASITSQGLWSTYLSNSNDAHIALKTSDGGSSIPNGRLQVKFEAGGSTIYLQSITSSWLGNTWYHVAVTWSGSRTRLYINGAEQDVETSNRGVRYAGINNFGRSITDTSRDWANPIYLNGLMDDIRVYSKALSATEVQSLNNTFPNCNNGILEAGEICDDGNSENRDFCTDTCELTNRQKSIIVMTDGEANNECPEQGTTGNLNGLSGADDAGDDAIQAAIDACNFYNITIYSVGFSISPPTVSNFSRFTLQNMVRCGGGYYEGSVSDIINIYSNISQSIITASYSEQTIVGEGIYTTLSPASYLQFSYDQDIPYGLVITAETPTFGTNAPIGTVNIPNNSTPYDIRAISYSGPKWTNRVQLNNSITGTWENVFNLGDYNSGFINLGDPYAVNIPVSRLQQGANNISVYVGLNSTTYEPGSQYNKIIYSVVKNLSSYSPVVSFYEGCTWEVEFEDLSTESIKAPMGYSGANICHYNNSIGLPRYAVFDERDAAQWAIFMLLQQLDLNNNGRLEMKITENQMNATESNVSGIPFTWDTEIKAIIWR